MVQDFKWESKDKDKGEGEGGRPREENALTSRKHLLERQD